MFDASQKMFEKDKLDKAFVTGVADGKMFDIFYHVVYQPTKLELSQQEFGITNLLHCGNWS